MTAAFSARDHGECSFCGSQCGQTLADLTAEFHEAFVRLVQAAPAPPAFTTNTSEYVDALTEAKRILDVR